MRVLSVLRNKVTRESRVDVAELAQLGRLRLLPDITERQYMLVNGTDVNPTAQAIEYDDAWRKWWLQWRACFLIFCLSALSLVVLNDSPVPVTLAEIGFFILAGLVNGVASLTFFLCILILPLWGLPPKDEAEKFWFLYRAFIEMSGKTPESILERGKDLSCLQKIATEILVKMATRVIVVRDAECSGAKAQTDKFTEAFQILRQLGYTAHGDREYYFVLAHKKLKVEIAGIVLCDECVETAASIIAVRKAAGR